MNQPPMIPLICHTKEFLYCTDLEAVQHADNLTLVAQLTDSVQCWNSYMHEIIRNYDQYMQLLDQRSEINPVVALASMRRLEKQLSFHIHFDRDEVLACLKVLQHVKHAKKWLDETQWLLEKVKQYSGLTVNAVEYLEGAACFYTSPPPPPPQPYPCAAKQITAGQQQQVLQIDNKHTGEQQQQHQQGEEEETFPPSYLDISTGDEASLRLVDPRSDYWVTADIADTLAPLFSGLRALWVCCNCFGYERPGRFTAILYYTVARVERSVEKAGATALHEFNELPSRGPKIKERLVYAQDACVAIQEQYHELRISLASSGPQPKNAHAVFSSIDDTRLFALVEMYFHRVTLLLELLDVLKRNPDKLGTVLTDEVLKVGNIMSNGEMSQEKFLSEIGKIEHEHVTQPKEIMQRMSDSAEATSAAHASQTKANGGPRVPFEKLTSQLAITVAFNPPCVTVIGGPIHHTTLDAMAQVLPGCCSNKGVLSLRKELRPSVFAEVSPKVMRMEIGHQFCDIDISQSTFLVTLLDFVEREGNWKLLETTAIHDQVMCKDVHSFLFRKRRATISSVASKQKQ